MKAMRGSVLIESALTLTLMLMLFYGALQLGVVGLEQTTADGGAFTAAHQQAFVGTKSASSVPAETLARSTLSHLQSNSIFTPALAPPPAAPFSGVYGFDQPNARFGGVSLVQPVQTIESVTTNFIANVVLGSAAPLSVTGTAVEPKFEVINPHFDLSGNDFGTAASFSTAADPLEDNAPPYFIGFNYMQICPDPISGTSATNWSVCPSGATITVLGTAEFLDSDNWARTTNGVTPARTAVFWETHYHQELFATIAQSIYLKSPAAKAAILDPTGGGVVACVYSFDNSYGGAYAAGSNGAGDPLFALHPDGSNGGSACPAP